VLRKFLYIWGAAVLLWLALSGLLLFRPASEQDWAVIMRNAEPMKWALALPAVFVLPLLSARRLFEGRTVQSRHQLSVLERWNSRGDPRL
jgi:hypothetical protein